MTKRMLIVGRGALAQAIVPRLQAAGFEADRLLQVSSEDSPLDVQTLRGVAVVLLVADDDEHNVDIALQARRLCPGLPMVVRVFDSALASYLAETLPGVEVLSMSRVSAPAFAAAARQVLAAGPSGGSSRTVLPSEPRRKFKLDRMLLGALFALFILVFPSAWYFSNTLGLRYMDALYFVWTTVMTVGYGDISLKDASDGSKLFGMLLMLSGASFIAVLFALLNDWVLSRRLDMLRGRIRVRSRGHVLIAGAGNVGLLSAELLANQGLRMVFIEADPDSRNAAALSAAGHHVILADATGEDILELAGIDRAALVMAVTDADAVNLKVALRARAHGVPAIMRALSPELAAHVTARGDGLALSPVASAADAFARTAVALAASAPAR